MIEKVNYYTYLLFAIAFTSMAIAAIFTGKYNALLLTSIIGFICWDMFFYEQDRRIKRKELHKREELNK